MPGETEEFAFHSCGQDLVVDHEIVAVLAMLDRDVCAGNIYGFEHEVALKCARRSADITAQLGLGLTQAVAIAMQASAHALAGRRQEMEVAIVEALALANGHPDVAGQVWGNARGLGSLLQEERSSALAALDEAMKFGRDPRCTAPGGIVGPLWARPTSLHSGSLAPKSACAGAFPDASKPKAMRRSGSPSTATCATPSATALSSNVQVVRVWPLSSNHCYSEAKIVKPRSRCPILAAERV